MTAVDTRPSGAIDKMWAREKHIAAVLPDHIDAKSFIGTAVAALYADAKLMQAADTSPETLIAALMECASLGHRPGTEEYYLTPRWESVKDAKGKPTGRKRPVILGIEGYRGIVERMYRSGAVANVVVREVCRGDSFEYIEGVHDKPIHTVDWFGEADRGPMIGVYAYATLTSGATSRVAILNRADVMKAKESSEGSDSESSPWNKHERAMWWKTAVRRLEPWLPTSSEYRMTEARATAQAVQATQIPAPPRGADIPVGGNTMAAISAAPATAEAREAIAGQMEPEFKRLSIVDGEEKETIICRLTGCGTGEATEAQLLAALDRLERADTTADLQ